MFTIGLSESAVVIMGLLIKSYVKNFIFINSNSQNPNNIFREHIELNEGLKKIGWDIQIKI